MLGKVVFGAKQRKFSTIRNNSQPARRPRPLAFDTLEDRSVPSAVSFLKVDAGTEGNWQGTYGQDGETVAGVAPANASYAQVTFNRSHTKIWASNTTDLRALQAPGGTGRIASYWQGFTYSLDVNLTDGQQHQLALYALDWTRAGRSDQIVATDAATGAQLDARTLSDFGGGKYLVYNVSGHVKFTVTALSGSSALLSGVFFDPVTATSPPPASPPPVSPPPVSPPASPPPTGGPTSPPPGANAAPTPAISGPFGTTPGSSASFTASATDPSAADTTAGFTYAWNFGDGSTAGGSSATHTYAAVGTYTLTLTATDQGGAVGTVSRTFTVGTPSASGITVTPDWITTPYDNIPNFGGHPTRTAVQSGAWSNPATWGGTLPTTGDVVSIPSGATVTYDQASDLEYDTVAIQAGGVLQFRTDVTTRLRVTNLLVMEGGTLTVGTAANPVAAGVKAEIVINDVPIDTTTDPGQYGHGLIALGTVTMHGAPLSDTFVNLAVEPKAGDTTLTLATPVTGWRAGDRLVLPDTRQLLGTERGVKYTPEWELPTVASVSADGRTVTLTSPLQFDHLGARDPDGVLRYMPDVGSLSRNVFVHSENIRGTRGYTMFTMRADVDIEYVQFGGLGRTTDAADDNTTYDANGNLTHVGTNEAGRYPVYLTHLMGPVTSPADGHQFTFSGNSVFCPLDPMTFRWGVTLNHADYGLVKDNVLFNWAGAGLVGESGAESYNLIQHNFVVGVRGYTSPQNTDGRDGSGYWFRGWNNYFVNNVAADAIDTFQGVSAGSGFNMYVMPATFTNTPVPLFPGANMNDPSQYRLINLQSTPILQFTGNKAYGAMSTGMVLWQVGTDGYRDTPIGQSVVKDFVAWHVWEEGFFGYPINNVLFDGFTVIGDARANPYDGGRGFAASDYRLNDVTIRNADIEGMYKGITYATDIQGTFTVEDSYFRNYNSNIDVMMLYVGGSGAPTDARKTVIDNVRFAPYPGAPSFTTIAMVYPFTTVANNYVQTDQVFVYNYNGTAGDNFQLFYLEQAPDFVVPQTTYYGPDNNGDGIPDWVSNHGSPEAGLTNAQNWAEYGIAIGGAISPTSATRANIQGFVLPL